MKNLFSYKNELLAGAFLVTFSTLFSCKKLIQIPVNPPTNITRQQVFADSATAISAVAGVYSFTGSVNNNGIPYFSGYYDLTTALSGHEVALTGGGDLAQFYNYTLNPQNGEINDLWSAPYSEIYQVNDVLAGITNNHNLSASFIKQITGEMDVVRALVYFYQVNLFGGVPLVTTTDYATNAQLPKATTAGIYTQILTDLNDATKKLTAAYATYPLSSGGAPVSSGHARPNLFTALALIAKVHLYQGNWKNAYTEADSVIKYGGFSLETDPANAFYDGSAEAIWQVPVQNVGGGSGDASNYVPYDNISAPSYVVTDSLLKKFEPNDLRKAAWMGYNIVGSDTLYYPFKYKDLAPTTPATDFMLIRFAEMYLIRAEAAAQMGNFHQAVADLNVIRARAGLGATFATAASPVSTVLAAIRHERQLEMCFEFGNRFFDLNRTSTDKNYPISEQAPAVLNGWQINDALYPIPQPQIMLNSHLIQNPGYH